MAVVVVVFIVFDARRVVINEYNAHARTVAVGIAAAAIATAKKRRRIANARAAAVAKTEAAKLTDEVDGTIDTAHGGNSGGGSPNLGGQSPAAPWQQRHPPLPSNG